MPNSQPRAELWIEYIPLADIQPAEVNPKGHDGSIGQSISRFGFNDPMTINETTGRLVEGHGRLEDLRARRARGEDAPERVSVDPDGEWLVPVVRGVAFDSDEEAQAYLLAHNRTTEAGGWTADLGKTLAGLRAAGTSIEGLGWSPPDLAEIIDGLRPNTKPPPDEVPPPPVEPVSVLGGVYEIGPHRLMCGDSTDPEAWAALMGDERARAVWTDPPYGVDVNQAKDIEEARKRRRRTDGKKVANDALSPDDLRALLHAAFLLAVEHCEKGAAWYVAAPAGPLTYEFATVLRDLEVWRWTLQWIKNSLVLGRADYHHRHEPVFYGWVPGAAHYFTEERTHDTVFEVARPPRSEEHPTMKPVELVRQMLANSTKPGWVVADPFGGSGTTLMACAVLGLKARLIELEPAYCDVIRRRYTSWARDNDLDPGPGALD